MSSYFILPCLLLIGQSDDPMALLEGVYNARKVIPSGRQVWLVRRQWQNEEGESTGSQEIRIEVVFENASARFVETKVADSVGNTSKICSILSDGEVLFNDSSKEGATVGLSQNGHGYMLCDPRTLGACGFFVPRVTLDYALSQQGHLSAQTVAREKLGTLDCYVVTVEKSNSWTTKYWIEPSSAFRVLRVEEWLFDQRKHVIESEYDQTIVSCRSLPSSIMYRKFASDGVVRSIVSLRVVESDVPFAIDEDVFSLNGLGLRLAEPVVDISRDSRLGYWNGTGFSPTTQEALSQRHGLPLVESKTSRRFLVIGGLFALAGLFFFCRYVNRKNLRRT